MNRRPDGVTIIAIYYFLLSLPSLIGACAILVVPISGALAGADRTGQVWAYFGLGLGFLFTFGGGVLAILTGWGLLRLKNWARWLAIVQAVLLPILMLPLLLPFPIFAIIGVFVIWYLLQATIRDAFEEAVLDSPNAGE
jgi:hypothetical protein